MSELTRIANTLLTSMVFCTRTEHIDGTELIILAYVYTQRYKN